MGAHTGEGVKMSILRKIRKRLKKPKTKWVTRKSFERSRGAGSWPFRVDRVCVERKGMLSFIRTPDGELYGTNGNASNYGHRDVFVHDIAIVGKDVGPFIAIALDKLAA